MLPNKINSSNSHKKEAILVDILVHYLIVTDSALWGTLGIPIGLGLNVPVALATSSRVGSSNGSSTAGESSGTEGGGAAKCRHNYFFASTKQPSSYSPSLGQ